MATVTAFEAKTRFGQLLERVARGEEVVITKHDKPVARLVPEGRPHLAAIRASAAGLRALQSRIDARTSSAPRITHKDFKSAVTQGRR